MNKAEMIREYQALCIEKGLEIDGVHTNSNKSEIQNAIDCLKCPDEILDEYMIVMKLKYPNMHRTIANNGNYKTHRFNRIYVYNTARLALA